MKAEIENDDFSRNEMMSNIYWQEREKQVLKSSFDDLFCLDFLVFLHKYLFNEIIEEKYLGLRLNLDSKDIEYINIKFLEVKKNLLNKEYQEISRIINDIYELQLFYDGNRRTLLTYIKILEKHYNIKKDISNQEENVDGILATKTSVNKK